MDEDGYKEVHFYKYCDSCRFKDLKENDSPCDECLAEPVNLHSHKPVKYVDKD